MTRRDTTLTSGPKATTFGASRAPYLAQGWESWALLPGRPGFKMVGRYLGGAAWCGLKASGLLRQGLAATLDLEDDGDWVTQAEADEWPTSTVCVLGRRYPAIDVDCDDPAACTALLNALAPTAIRGRTGSPRFLVPFLAADPVQGWRPILFTLPGSTTQHAIEWNGDGKQWLASGAHPKGGSYGWTIAGALRTVAAMPPSVTNLPVVTAEDASRMRAELVEVLRGLGAIFLKGSDQEVRQAAAGEDVDPMELPALITEEQLAELLAAVPDSPETVGGWDEGVALLAAMRAALGRDGEQVPECVLDWAAGYPGARDGAQWAEDRWRSFHTVRSGKGPLMQWAQKHAPAELYERLQKGVDLAEVKTVFDVVEGDMGRPPAGVGTVKADGSRDTMLEQCRRAFVYREPTGEWVRVRDGAIMKREVFNDTTEAREAAEEDYHERAAAAAPGQKVKPLRPHELMMQRGCVRVQAVTYRPGRGKLFREEGVEMFNIYTAPERPHAGTVVAESQVRPFLDLLGWVLPGAADRELMLDWFSFIAQRPGIKVQWAPVLLSETNGVGKDLLLGILADIVGRANFASIEAARLDGDFNADWALSQVVYVLELPRARKRDYVDKLKAVVASHAGQLSVNQKGQARYSVPNDHCWVFTTNHTDALVLDLTDRRFAILQAREQQLDPAIRDAVVAFNAKGGRALAAEWLRQREISATFSPHSCPAASEAKKAMTEENVQGAAAALLDRLREGAWVERRAVWETELEGIRQQPGGHINDLRKALKAAGFTRPARADAGGRVAVGKGSKVRKLNVWVRDLAGPVETEAEALRTVSMRDRTARAVVEVLSAELGEYDAKAATAMDSLLRLTGLKAV